MRFLLILISQIYSIQLFGQTLKNYTELVIKDEIAYYKGNPYTGKVIRLTKEQGIIYNFNNGLLHGKIKEGNELRIYNNGMIEEFICYQNDNKEIVHFKNNNPLKPIKSIALDVYFENEVNDTIYVDFDKLKDQDSTKFKLGINLKYKNGHNDFIEIKDFKFVYSEWSICCVNGFNIGGYIYNNGIRNNILKRHCNLKIYLTDMLVKIHSNEQIKYPYCRKFIEKAK